MDNFLTFDEAQRTFRAHLPELESRGISWDASVRPVAYLPEPFRRNMQLAMDALPVLSTNPNSAIPVMLTTFIDPQIYRILFAPLAAVEIYGEELKGDWTQDTTIFPVVEHTGEVSSYGDFATSGRAGANTDWPMFQAYLFQTIMEYGERELERAGLARINWVSELGQACATIMARAMNTIYHYGVQGLQNYGLVNNPYLSAALTPSTKTAGGTTWFTNAGAPNAQANEVYNDIVALFQELVTQSAGLVRDDDKLVLVLPNTIVAALNFTNTFNVNVLDLLKKNFPKLRVVQDTLFAVKSSTNPTGSSAGNLVQLIVEEIEGQKTGFCAYNIKMRAHPIIPELSAFKQKMTSGSWGHVLRMPMGVAQMIGC